MDVIIDTETTGLKPGNDEILQLAIIDTSDNVLFNELIKPAKRKRWPDAQKIHGISWNDVKGCKTLLEHRDKIEGILRQARYIVGYNCEFDVSMLKAGGITVSNKTIDVMKEYSSVYGTLRPDGSRKWMKLSDCAEHYGYKLNDAHDALADARATAHCLVALANDPVYKHAKEEAKQRAYLQAQAQGSSGQTSGSSGFPIGCLILICIFVFGIVLVVSNELFN